MIQSTASCLKGAKKTINDNLCLFRALALHLHGTQRLEGESPETFTLFINKVVGLIPNHFQGVHMKDIVVVEDLLTLSFLLYDINFENGNTIVEFVRRSVKKNENTVRLLRYNNRFWYVSNIIAVFQSFRFSNCDTFFNRSFNLERHSTKCSEPAKLTISAT